MTDLLAAMFLVAATIWIVTMTGFLVWFLKNRKKHRFQVSHKPIQNNVQARRHPRANTPVRHRSTG